MWKTTGEYPKNKIFVAVVQINVKFFSYKGRTIQLRNIFFDGDAVFVLEPTLLFFDRKRKLPDNWKIVAWEDVTQHL